MGLHGLKMHGAMGLLMLESREKRARGRLGEKAPPRIQARTGVPERRDARREAGKEAGGQVLGGEALHLRGVPGSAPHGRPLQVSHERSAGEGRRGGVCGH